MCLELGRADARRKRFGPLQGAYTDFRDNPHRISRRQPQPCLTTTDQLQINTCGELCVEKRAVFRAARQIDSEAPAKLVQQSLLGISVLSL